MATKTKDYSIRITDQQDIYEFSAKKKNAIYILGINQNDIDTSSFRIVGNHLLFSAKGKDFIVSDYTGIKYIKTYNTETYKSELLDIISECLVDNTNNEINILSRPNYNAKKLTLNGTNYNDVINAQWGYEPTGKTNIKKNKGLTINGGNGNDEITGTAYNDVIKGGNGNDTIIGGKGNDTITGGSGISSINYNDGDGYDVINLSRDEYLDIYASVPYYRYRLVGKNLVILFDNDENSGSITLKNYTKDILKAFVFNGATYESVSELANDVTFYYDNTYISKKGVLTGSAYNDEIAVENTTTKKYTINAGNGVNDITVTGGKNVINSGKDNDTVNIYENGNYVVNAGAGTNNININTDNFGTVTINEQKVNAVNNINFSYGLSESAEYQRKGNDLYIINNGNQVIVKNYYATVKNKTSWNINGQDLETHLSEQTTDITGSGKIYGTVNDDNITISGKKSVTIYAGKGNDTIGYAKGNRTIYLSEGDGYDVIEKGDGVVTLRFSEDLKLNKEIKKSPDGKDIIILHYGNQNDTLVFTNCTKTDNIYYYIGKKKYLLSALDDFKIDTFKESNFEDLEFRQNWDSSLTIVDTVDETKTLTLNNFDLNLPNRNYDYLICKDGTYSILNDANIIRYNHTLKIGVGSDYNEIFDLLGGDHFCIGGDGNDLIINNERVYGNILGEAGNDTITNNGYVRDIIGGAGNDTITTEEDSSCSAISFSNGDGYDILYLNAAINNLNFVSDTGDKTYTWSGDDLVIGYNSDNDSVIIKNYNPVDTNVVVNIGTDNANYVDLATLVPEKPENTIDTNIFSNSNFENLEFSHSGTTLTIVDTTDVSKTLTIKEFDLTTPSTNFNSLICSDGVHSILTDAQITVKDFSGSDYNEIMTNESNISSISGGLGNDRITNNGTVSGDILGSDGNDTITVLSTATVTGTIDGGDGSDIIINNGVAGGFIYGCAGNDTITTGENSSCSGIGFNTGDGHDTLYLNAAINNLKFPDNNGYHYHRLTWVGDDLVISYNNEQDSVTIKNYNPSNSNVIVEIDNMRLLALVGSKYINGSEGDDNIIFDSDVYMSEILGNDGNDTITNYGTLTSFNGSCGLSGGGGNDIITNNGTVTSYGYISGSTGNDTIINNGSTGYISGGEDNDNITNNGIVTEYISGSTGNDTITTEENSSAYGITFTNGDGYDTLYLNAAVNNLNFIDDTVYKIHSWVGDDLVLTYNKGNDSVIIKNYNPLNTNVVVNIGTDDSNYVNLATLVPEKPAPQMMMASPMMSMNELNSQVVAFSTPNDLNIIPDNPTQDQNDIPTLIAEYT